MQEQNEPSAKTEGTDLYQGRLSCNQAGYLPIPLQCVPIECLAEMRLFTCHNGIYTLYRNVGIHFGPRDYNRLVKSGIEFVYTSVNDHLTYYQTIEKYLNKIVINPRIQLEKKSEILYATSLELAHQLLCNTLGEKDIQRTENMVNATLHLIMHDKSAFGRLYEISNHDFYTATHMVNVCVLTLYVAHRTGIKDKTLLQRMGVGAMLHDIGKKYIPVELLNTPRRLTPDEYALIQTHVNRGTEYISELKNIPAEVRLFVAEHHERLDGSGYPRGLKGEHISTLGRMAGIIDVFDSMTSIRPYREETYSVDETLRHLSEQASRKYDLSLVQAFQSVIQQGLGMKKGQDESLDFALDNVRNLSAMTFSESSDQRKHLRYHIRMAALMRRIRRINNRPVLGTAEKVIIHNISCSGLGLLSQRPVKPQENLCISILSEGEDTVPPLIAVLVYCHEHQDGWFTLGLKLYQPLSSELINKMKSPKFIRHINTLT